MWVVLTQFILQPKQQIIGDAGQFGLLLHTQRHRLDAAAFVPPLDQFTSGGQQEVRAVGAALALAERPGNGGPSSTYT